jgi:hypothetical protein
VIDNGVDRGDIICTDGGNGGRELNSCSLFHFYIKAGRVYATDGTLVSRLSDLTSTGVSYSKLSKIYDVKENGAAWGWDVCLEPGTGYPVCVFAVFPSAVPALTAITGSTTAAGTAAAGATGRSPQPAGG